jgi:hypothetical protein
MLADGMLMIAEADQAGVKSKERPSAQVIESRPPIPESSMMVLLVDHQAIVAHAVRRLLADLPDIDLHYCSDPIEAVRDAPPPQHVAERMGGRIRYCDKKTIHGLSHLFITSPG